MHTIKKIFQKAFILLSLSMLSSCTALLVSAGTAIGAAGAYAFINGELKVTEKVSLNDAWAATNKTLADLGYQIINKDFRSGIRTVKVENTGDEEIVITMEEETHYVTSFRIRIGFLGDEETAKFLLNSIKENFPKKSTSISSIE